MTFLPDVFGHESAKEQLSRMLEQDRVPNGVLLHGEAGRGKRTLAMAFARAMVGTGVDDHPDLFVVTRGEDQRLVGIDRVRALKQAMGKDSPVAAPGRRRTKRSGENGQEGFTLILRAYGICNIRRQRGHKVV